MTKVLLVEDDQEQAQLAAQALMRAGHDVVTAADGADALKRWAADSPDLVLLDIDLPKISGFEVCRRIRQEADTPIILVTGYRREEDVVRGLQMGADDYVIKPFSIRQLAARMEAVLRAYERSGHVPESTIEVGDLVLDLRSHTAIRGGHPVALTQREFGILELLARNAGQVVPYASLIQFAWGFADEHTPRLLKSHITHLRRKLGMPADARGGIQSIWGVGYMLDRPGRASSASWEGRLPDQSHEARATA